MNQCVAHVRFVHLSFSATCVCALWLVTSSVGRRACALRASHYFFESHWDSCSLPSAVGRFSHWDFCASPRSVRPAAALPFTVIAPSVCSRVSSVPLALLKPTVSSGAAPHGYGVTTDHGTIRQILSRLWPGESLVSAMICSRSRDGRFLIHTPSSRRALLLLSQLPRSSSRAAVA